jgi:hypothetical protein
MLLVLFGIKCGIINMSLIYDESTSIFIKLTACAIFYIFSYIICIFLFVICIVLYALYSYIRNVLM